MDKREFIKSLAALLVTLPIIKNCKSKPKVSCMGKRWMWAHGNKDWKKEMKRIKSMGIDAVLMGGSISNIDKVYPYTKENGMELHLWRWIMNRPNNKQVKKHWYAISRNGDSCKDKRPYVDYYQWLCPSNEEVQMYLMDEMKQLSENPKLDGISFDYIRYCDVILPIALQPKYNIVQDKEYPEYDFCYCKICRDKFKKQTGLEDPLDMKDPSASKEWKKFRYDSITNIVNKMYDTIKQVDDKKIVSASVFPYPELARKLVRQSWDDWKLDVVMPMLYQDAYNEGPEWIAYCIEQINKTLNKNTKLCPALYVLEVNRDELLKEIELIYKAKSDGLALFSNTDTNEEKFHILNKYLDDCDWIK